MLSTPPSACAAFAAFAMCLAGSPPAAAQVNSETGARDFIVRQAEIDRVAEGAELGEEAAPAGARPAAKVRAGASGGSHAQATTAKAGDARLAASKAKPGAGARGARTAPAVPTPADGPPSPGFSAVERAKAAFARSLTASAQIDPIGSRGAPVAAAPPAKAETTAAAPPVAAAPVGAEGLRALVARHAAANGVPFALADAIIRIESRYNPRAAHAGNYGLMQIRHQTARGMGYGGSPAGLLEAETNARFGMKYLALAYRLAGGDTCRTIMKYQSGHMAERMSGANRTYCAKVRTFSARS